MVNKVILIGNLGQDPEIRSTAGGTSVGKLSLATKSRVKKGDEWIDETEWHKIVVFGRDADNVGKFCKKGKQLYVEGRLKTNKWQDKEGKDRYTTEIVADSVKFLGGGDREEGSSGGYGGNRGGGSTGYGGGSGGGTSGGSSSGGGAETPPYTPDDSIPF